MPYEEPPELKSATPARLAAIIESSDDAIVSKTLEGVVTTWNKGAERIFGWTAEEIIGKPINAIIPPDRQHEEPNILRRIRAGERVDHFETIRMTKAGRSIEVSVTISPIRDESGKIVGASKIARDITLQRQTQRELVAAKEAAEAANQAKDQFLSVLSHELRTPLTPALSAISFIEAHNSAPSDLRDQIGMIRRNIETEARLVDDLLDLTRIARGKIQLHFEIVDAHAVMRDVVRMFQPEIDEKAIAITLALRAKEFNVWADPGRFQQVLLNLVSNAVKFTEANGAITINSRNEDGKLIIEVIDNGVGIHAEVLPRLFTAFEQGDPAVTRRFGGLGLGLSIVKSLISMHGGTVAGSSTGRDQGSKFTLTLPTLPSRSGEMNPSEAKHDRTYGGLRILLVEDHTDTRQIMMKLLTSFGCIVHSAASVSEAIEMSQKQTYDLLVSDIGLPDGTGLDVMRYLRQRQPIRGIALSGYGQDDDLRRSREAGFEQHLIKPINFQVLKDVLRKVAN